MTDKPKPHSNQGKADPDKDGRDHYKRHVDGDITIRGQIETHVPPSAAQQHDSERREDEGREKKKFIVEVLTLIAVVVYAGITTWQAYLSQTAIKDNREYFIKDHAPYIWAKPELPVINLNEPLRWDVGYSNYGRSPALDLHSCIRAGYGPLGLSALLDSAKWWPVMSSPACQNLPARSSSVVPPMFPQYTTAFGDKPLTQTDLDTIKSTDGGALVMGIIDYSDSAGNTYETGFCFYRLQSEAIMNCEKYNYIKQTN